MRPHKPDLGRSVLNWPLTWRREPSPGVDPSHEALATGQRLVPGSLTDRGNAHLFVKRHARDYRHVSGLGWYRWSGTHWENDEKSSVLWAAGDLAESIAESDPAGRYSDADLREHRLRALSTPGANAMLAQAASDTEMALDLALLDADPHVLCTPSGIVDLRSGRMRVADPDKDFHSRSTITGPRTMPTPRWNEFLTATFGADAEGAEMIRFLQLLLGYSVSGDMAGQVLPFLFGAGNNGKSVLLDVVLKLLGDYADVAPPGFLMTRPYRGHPTELAELHGRRIIVCSEVKPGDIFDEARVNLLTGGDRIQARRMRQDYFSFAPTHTIWLLGNHRPEVGSGGLAFWHRIRLIPFARVVSDDRRIDNLANILVTEEGPGILAWLIAGARRYFSGQVDLTGPEQVRVATTSYAQTEDHTARFFTECCELDDTERIGKAALYCSYLKWCQREGVPSSARRVFAARVRELAGLASSTGNPVGTSPKYYSGIRLLVCV